MGKNDCKSRAGQIRTLVVDDSPVALRATRDFLDSVDRIDVVANARNGKDALVLAETLDPDLIVMDVQMPGMNGLDVLVRLHQHKIHAKVILVTAHFADELQEACKAGGAVGLIQKERLIDEFDEMLKNAFANQANSGTAQEAV